MGIQRELLDVLACPACVTRVLEHGDDLICTNADCRRRYAVRDGIPVMLIDESEVLDPESWKSICGDNAHSSGDSTQNSNDGGSSSVG